MKPGEVTLLKRLFVTFLFFHPRKAHFRAVLGRGNLAISLNCAAILGRRLPINPARPEM